MEYTMYQFLMSFESFVAMLSVLYSGGLRLKELLLRISAVVLQDGIWNGIVVSAGSAALAPTVWEVNFSFYLDIFQRKRTLDMSSNAPARMDGVQAVCLAHVL